MEFEPMLTPREKSPLPENVPRGVSNPRHFGSEPKHYQLSYSGPCMDLTLTFDVLSIFYFNFLSVSEKGLQRDVLQNILSKHGVSEKTRKAIQEKQVLIQKTFQNTTKQGKERKREDCEEILQSKGENSSEPQFVLPGSPCPQGIYPLLPETRNCHASFLECL